MIQIAETKPKRPQRAVLVKENIWPTLRYKPHKGQQLIHASKARHRVASCGRRFGKSRLGGNELVPEALYTHTLAERLRETQEQRYFWIVGPNYTDCEKEFRVLWNALKWLEVPFDKPGCYYNVLGGDMQISLWGGRFMLECRSAAHADSIVGEGLHGVLMVEAARMKQRIWSKFVRPALADKRGWSLQTSTPEGKNWFYEHWVRGQDPLLKAWDSWRMPSWINDRVFKEGRQDPEILDMETELSSEAFKQQVEADFTEFVGRVFKSFDEEVHVTDLRYRPDLPVYGACDYGWTNPFVWLDIQVDAFDNVYVLNEYRATRRDINDVGKDLAALPLPRRARRFYPDPSEPGDTRILEKALRIRANHNTGGPLKDRVEMIREHLKLMPEKAPIDLQKPRLFIDRNRCKDLIWEMSDGYRYPENKSDVRNNPEDPMDKDNHGPEALGRFFRGYFGPMSGTGRAKSKQATVSR